MNWFKRFIVRVFRIKTYEREYNQYKNMYESSQKNYSLSQAVIDTYKEDLAKANEKINELHELYKDPISYVNKELEQATIAYEQCAKDLERMLATQDNLEHRAFARGRQAAYSEMGIRALNARLAGNTLYMDENGDVTEEINPKSLEQICEEEEIEIDDLIDIA